MKLNIEPEDLAQPEQVTFWLHPDLIQRLKNDAESLNGSRIDHVLSRILDQVLTPAKPAKKEKRASGQKTRKETREEPAKAA